MNYKPFFFPNNLASLFYISFRLFMKKTLKCILIPVADISLKAEKQPLQIDASARMGR